MVIVMTNPVCRRDVSGGRPGGGGRVKGEMLNEVGCVSAEGGGGGWRGTAGGLAMFT